jgi:transketolase
MMSSPIIFPFDADKPYFRLGNQQGVQNSQGLKQNESNSIASQPGSKSVAGQHYARPRSQRYTLMQRRELPAAWDRNLPAFAADPKGIAGRDGSGKVLNVLAQSIPWLLGGSADLGPSNKTTLTYEGAGDFQADNPSGKNLHFGIREHAMAAIVNGLSLSKLRAYGASFFIFSDYARPAIRLSALMELPTIFIFTHDAMGDGEDGPTHQPVEHLASLRAIPGLVTLRPGDANEVVEAYRYIMQLRHEPAVLVLSRQPLPTLDRKRTRQHPVSRAERTSLLTSQVKIRK